MIEASPLFASLTAEMIRRPAMFEAGVADAAPAESWWHNRDLRHFLTAFTGGFIFFYALIA